MSKENVDLTETGVIIHFSPRASDMQEPIALAIDSDRELNLLFEYISKPSIMLMCQDLIDKLDSGGLTQKERLHIVQSINKLLVFITSDEPR